jgi:tetratricopeptide (TPR) repeat protein
MEYFWEVTSMRLFAILAALAIITLSAVAQEDTASQKTFKGYDLLYQMKYEDALRAFDDALSTNQSWVAAMAGKGSALDHLGNYSEALEIFNRSIEIAPYYVRGYVGKGAALEDLNRSDEAMDFFNISLELDPGNAIAWNERAWLHYKRDEYEDTLKDADKGIKLMERELAGTLDSKCMALLGLGRNNESMECINRAIQLEPSIAELWYHKGYVLKAMGREDDAEKAYATARNSTPIWPGGEEI